LPVTREVTSYATHVFDPIAPLSSTAPLVRAGRIFQVIPVSDQLLLVAYTAGPLTEPSVAYTRSLALWMAPVTPVTVKRR